MTRFSLTILCLILSLPVFADDVPRTLTVSGLGTAPVAPDRATVTLSIMVRNPSVAGAQQSAAQVAEKVLALADELDIPTNRVDTMSASVYPDYRYNQARQEQEIRGYVAQREMRIDLHDLEKVGVVVERAVEEGVNQVSPPQLRSSREREAYRDALENAVEDARANAERLADALGLTLGPAIQTSAGAPIYPRTTAMAARYAASAMAVEDMAETYSPGDMTIRANVTVVFELGQE